MSLSAIIGALRVNLGLDSTAFQQGIEQANATLASTGKKMQSVGQSLSLKLTAPLAVFGGLVLKTAGDFEASMNRVQAALGASSDEMAALSDIARDLGKSTIFSAVEAADAIEMLAKNGVSTADILGGTLQASLDLAAASGAGLASAADLATDVMLNFGKSSEELASVVDGVSGVLLTSKFGFDDYRLALAQAGGVAGGLGVTLEDFNAVIAATSARFASGSDAGTSFKTFLQRLVPQSKAAASAMTELGLEFFNADGSMKSMAEVAQQLQGAFSGLSDEAKSDALTKLFGTDAMRTAIGLMEAGADGIRELDAAISQASAAEQAEARTKGWTGAIEELGGAFDELRLVIAESGLLEMATNFVRAMTNIVDKISEADPKLVQFGVIFGVLAAAVGPVLIALGATAAAIAAIGVPVAAVIAGIAALTAAVIAFWPEIKALDAAFTAWVQGIQADVIQALTDLGAAMVRAKDDVIAFGTQALDWIKAKPAEIAAAFSGLREQFMQIGRDILSGLWDGLKESWAGLSEWWPGVAGSFESVIRAVTRTQSPSQAFYEVGVDLMAGLQLGIEGGAQTVANALVGVAQNAAGTLGGLLGIGQEVAQGFGQINNKMLRSSQIFGAAQAWISTLVGAAKALELPFPANLAAVAKVIATGSALVASIKGGGKSGGSSGRSGGGSGSITAAQRVATPTTAAQAAKQAPLDIRLHLPERGMFTAGQVSELLDGLTREAGDRGMRLLTVK